MTFGTVLGIIFLIAVGITWVILVACLVAVMIGHFRLRQLNIERRKRDLQAREEAFARRVKDWQPGDGFTYVFDCPKCTKSFTANPPYARDPIRGKCPVCQTIAVWRGPMEIP